MKNQSGQKYSTVLKEPSLLPSLGIVEGFYGRSWTWDERNKVATFLADAGYDFYIYAPKADSFLRRNWKNNFPQDHRDALCGFSQRCQKNGMRFGVGLSPYNIFVDFNDAEKSALARKIEDLDDLNIDDLAILFDDMPGGLPDLAQKQIAVVDFIADRTTASRLIVCPSYYSYDPVLDRVFGARPKNYLRDLGNGLDSKIDIFWTGEEVCSREFSPGHLMQVAEQLKRRPFLWDNYPVNDGARMSAHLHLRAFTGRPPNIAPLLAAHAINPALQPTLTLIPALTLIDSYQLGDQYQYGKAFQQAAIKAVGPALAEYLIADLLVLQDLGRERLGDRLAALHKRYSAMDHEGAREIVEWLDGRYAISDEVVQTQ